MLTAANISRLFFQQQTNSVHTYCGCKSHADHINYHIRRAQSKLNNDYFKSNNQPEHSTLFHINICIAHTQKIWRVNCIKVLANLSLFLESLFHLFIHSAKVQLHVVPMLKYAQRREVWRRGIQLQSFLRFTTGSFYFRKSPI
jgi:hypothetical protein